MMVVRKDSSETTRETTFDFSSFFNYLAATNASGKQPSVAFLQWFVGFVEGDGNFLISGRRLFFIITQKDMKTLYFIRKNLGFGKVSKYGKYGRFIVADTKGSEKLVYLFNGNLLLKKTNSRFQEWLVCFNLTAAKEVYFEHRSLLPDLRSNAWFSGFSAAEGCFNAIITKNIAYKLGFRFRARFLVDQKNEPEILNHMLVSFKCGYIATRKDGLNQRFILDAFKSFLILASYFDKFPINHCLKEIAYLKWKRYITFISSKEVIADPQKLVTLAKSINKLEEADRVDDIVRP